jgi:hypothetical protein
VFVRESRVPEDLHCPSRRGQKSRLALLKSRR